MSITPIDRVGLIRGSIDSIQGVAVQILSGDSFPEQSLLQLVNSTTGSRVVIQTHLAPLLRRYLTEESFANLIDPTYRGVPPMTYVRKEALDQLLENKFGNPPDDPVASFLSAAVIGQAVKDTFEAHVLPRLNAKDVFKNPETTLFEPPVITREERAEMIVPAQQLLAVIDPIL